MPNFKTALMGTPVYPFARAIKRAMRAPQQKLSERLLREFYSQFFTPGEVVFDVGGLMGEYAEAFAAKGARVITFEPNPAYQPRLRALARHCNITPVFAAVSDTPGSATLNVCSTPGYSTLLPANSNWMVESPNYDGVQWTRQVEVPVTTLDAVAGVHGVPSFVKIDVEGFELKVLRGMSFTPRYVSFEFGTRRKDLGLECVAELAPRGYEFRPIFDRDFEFVTPDWMDGEQTKAWLEGVQPETTEYGDLFARRR